MQSGAHVTSIAAFEGVRAGVCLFADEVGSALAILQSEIGRFVEWLEHDQLAHWRREIRLREERLAEAKTDLHRCLAATIDPQRTPSCYQEKKVVESCKRRLEEAEHKLAAVRRWIPIVRQAVFEYTLKVEPLQSAVSADMPRAAAAIDGAIARILAYVAVALPRTAEPAAMASSGTASGVTASSGNGGLPTIGTRSVAPTDEQATSATPEQVPSAERGASSAEATTSNPGGDA